MESVSNGKSRARIGTLQTPLMDILRKNEEERKANEHRAIALKASSSGNKVPGFNRIAAKKTRQSIRLRPDQAEWLLQFRDPRQRNIRSEDVARHAELMVSGNWVQDCSPGLAFNRGGYLVQGQHRLTAQVKTGVTLTWFVETGVTDNEIVMAMDQGGRPRTQGQSITLAGETPMGPREEAVIKAALDIEVGARAHIKYSIDQILEARERYGDDIKWALSLPPRLGPSCLCAAFMFVRHRDKGLAQGFVDIFRSAKLLDGIVEDPNHPAVVLARHLNAKDAKYGTTYKREVMSKALYCMMKMSQGDNVIRLRGWDDMGSDRAQSGRNYFVGA